MFALNEQEVKQLTSQSRTEIVDYLKDELEEEFYDKKADYLAEFDKSWFATHLAFSNNDTTFEKNGDYPLNHTIYGEKALYGNKSSGHDEEEDYIITLSSPAIVKDVYDALSKLTEVDFRAKYDAIDEAVYDYPKSEEDFYYSWDWLQKSLKVWKLAIEKGLYVVFSADQ